jgi:uncharacterized protein (TIGR02246 family)
MTPTGVFGGRADKLWSVTMGKHLLLPITLLTLAAGGCAEPVDLEAEAAAIRQLTDVEWLEAGRARDLERWLSFYTDDTIFFPTGGPAIVGKEAMREMIAEFLSDPANGAVWATTEIEVSRSGDMAYSYGPQQTTLVGADGRAVTHDQKWSIVWRKEPGGSWKCAFMTMDFDSGPEASPQADADIGSSDEADVQAILDFEQALYDAQIAGDFEAWMASFADDVVLFPPNASPLTGISAIRRFNAPIFEEFDLHESSDEREVAVAGDWAYIRAHWTWVQSPKDGSEPIEDSGNSIWVLRRQLDGSWKIARAIWNSDRPAPGGG